MAITKGTPASVIANDATNPKTVSVTCGGSNRSLLVAVVRGTNQNIDALSYGGTSILSNTISGAAAGSSGLFVDFFHMTPPPSGTATLSCTLSVSGSSNFGVFALPLEGVDQSTPYSNGANASSASSTPSVNVTSATGSLVVDAFFLAHNAGGSTTTVGGGQTADVDAENYDLANSAGMSSEAGAGTVTMSWSATNPDGWAQAAVSVNAAAAFTTEEEGFRWRNDDGSESAATWAASQDSDLSHAAGTMRLRMLINTASGDPSSDSYQLNYKLSTDSTYSKVEVAGGSTAAFGAIGTVTTTGTTAPTVAYPTGITAGDLLIMAVANRPNASTPSTPSGWTAPSNNSATGGAGSEAAGTGTVRMTVFTRVADGSESGSVTLSISSGASCGAAIWRCSKTTGKQWSVSLVNGSDNSAGTSVSVAFSGDPGVTADDLVFVAYANSEDTATFASQAMSQSGITYGTMTERTDTAITTGNDLRLVITQHAVTSGTSAGSATWTATASGTNSTNSAGPAVMIRARQIDQPIQMALSSNIAASGEATTAQLTAPSGKSTSDFVAGRIQDDENPADAVDITSSGYTELEWCIKSTSSATVSDVYQFRVLNINTYTVTPQWTISNSDVTTAAGGSASTTAAGTQSPGISVAL